MWFILKTPCQLYRIFGISLYQKRMIGNGDLIRYKCVKNCGATCSMGSVHINVVIGLSNIIVTEDTTTYFQMHL